MNPELQNTLDDFIHTLDEVEILLMSAEVCVNEEAKYAVYIKSALLLLSGKFEKFVEFVTDVYVFIVNNLGLRSSSIPETLRLHHTYSMLDKVQNHKSTGQTANVIRVLNEISSLWVLDNIFSELKIECKFAYGKHGENELKKLFIPIGIEDVFEQVKVYLPDEIMADERQTKLVDFKGVFNSITNLRNNILHQDATPNLTHTEIREYKLVFQNFATELIYILDSKISAMVIVI